MCTVAVVISQIKEVRVGRNTDILRNKEFEGSWQDACIFSVIFGENFESLDLIANSADEANIWVTGLTYLTTGRHKSGGASQSYYVGDRRRLKPSPDKKPLCRNPHFDAIGQNPVVNFRKLAM